MKTLWITALVSLSLIGTVDSVLAQQGGRDYGYDAREYGGRDRGYDDDRRRGVDGDDDGRRDRGRGNDNDRGRERGRGYDEDRDRQRGRSYDDDDRERGRGNREDREAGFEEDEYLRCHPDVRRAVERGEMKSGEFHYKTFGRREGRRLTCPTKL